MSIFKKLTTSLVVAVAMVLSSNGAFSADFTVPTQKIEGVESPVPLGDIVFLNLSQIQTKPEAFSGFTVDWKVFLVENNGKLTEKKFHVMSENSIFFGSGITNAKFKVFASVSYLYVLKDKDGKFLEAGTKSVLLVADLVIGEDKQPLPDDSTVFPDGKYKLASSCYKLAKDKVVVDRRAEGASKLANSFETMAAKIAAGKDLSNSEDIKNILRETTESNQKALEDINIKSIVWNGFAEGLQDLIYDFYSNGKLSTKEDFVVAWREIALGLKGIK